MMKAYLMIATVIAFAGLSISAQAAADVSTLSAAPKSQTAWQTSVRSEAKALRSQDAKNVAKLYALKGLDYATYRQWRRPEPAVNRELKGMPELAALMMQIHQEGLGTYPYGAGPNRQQERQALAEGLLSAIGLSGHPQASAYLLHALRLKGLSSGERQVGIRALGRTRSLEGQRFLKSLSLDSGQSGAKRALALTSLAHSYSDDTLDFVLAYLSPNSTAIMQKAALSALSVWASRSKLASRKTHEKVRHGSRLKAARSVVAWAKGSDETIVSKLAPLAGQCLGVLKQPVQDELNKAFEQTAPASIRLGSLRRMQEQLAISLRRPQTPWVR
jgi:hypothetical protein